MILKSFLLGNLLSLCMKIINSVVVVGLYYGFLTIFSIGPSYLFLLRARVMEEGTEKEISATTGFITGQLMMFISIYYAPLHLALGRPHTITVLVLPYLLFHFFWNNHRNFLDYGSTTRNSMRNLSIQCIFLNNLIFQLFNHFILPSSTLARLVNIYMFRCNNKILFITSSFLGWLIGHILFIKWVGLILFWIQKNYSIQSNKYFVSELKNLIARIFSILLFITCVYYLGRMPLPIVTKKLKESSETEERVESEEDRDVEITSEKKMRETIEEQKGYTNYENSYLDIYQEPSELESKEEKSVSWFEKPLVTFLFDYKRWNRPLRYIKNDRFENAVRNEMSQYFFYPCPSDGKQRISFTYPPSLSTFSEMIERKMFLYTTEKLSHENKNLYNNWIYTNEQKKENLSSELINRIKVLEKQTGSLVPDVLEKRIRLYNDENEEGYLPKKYDPFLNGPYRGKIKKFYSRSMIKDLIISARDSITEDSIWINKIHSLLPNNYREFEDQKNEFVDSEELLSTHTHIDNSLTPIPRIGEFSSEYQTQEQRGIDSENQAKDSKFLFNAITNDSNNETIRNKFIAIEDINKKVPRWSYKLTDDLEEEEEEENQEEPKEDHEIRSRKAKRVVIYTDKDQDADTSSSNNSDQGEEVSLIRYSQQSDFRRDLIKGSMRAQRRKTVTWEMFQANAHSPLFLDQIDKTFFFSFDFSEMMNLIFRNWMRGESEILISDSEEEETKEKKKKNREKKDENERIAISEAWDTIIFAQAIRGLMLVTQSFLRKYIKLPFLIIAKNIGRMLLLQFPEWYEDLRDWNREMHIKCTYNGVQLSETEFPKNWLTDGIQIKILFPFCLKPWQGSKVRSHHRDKKEEKDNFCFLTIWGTEVEVPFGSPRKQPSFFEPIFNEFKKKYIKVKKKIFLVLKVLKKKIKWFIRALKEKTKWIQKIVLVIKGIIKEFEKRNPILLFELNKNELVESEKNSIISNNNNKNSQELIIQIQSINWINYSLVEKKMKDLIDRTITIRNQIEQIKKDKKKIIPIPDINIISPNKTNFNDKKSKSWKDIWLIFKRRKTRLIRKLHYFIKSFIERIYIDIFLYIINILRVNVQFFVKSIEKKMEKSISNNKTNQEGTDIDEPNKNMIPFILTIKKYLFNISSKNFNPYCDLSSLSQAYVFYKISQIQASNKYHLRPVLQYHGTHLFLKDQIKDYCETQGIFDSKSKHKQIDINKSRINEWKSWLKSHHQYNLSQTKWSRLVPKKWRNGVNQRCIIQNENSMKLSSYKEEKDPLICYVKPKYYGANLLMGSQKEKFKRNCRYDLLLHKYINYENSEDSYISELPLQVNRDREILYSYNLNTQKPQSLYILMDIDLSDYLGEEYYIYRKKNLEKKYFNCKIFHFFIRQNMHIDTWINMHIGTKINKNTKTRINSYQKFYNKNILSLTIHQEIKTPKSNQKRNLFDWMGMNQEKLYRHISNRKPEFFPEFGILYDTYNAYKIKPWIIPIKLLLNFDVNENSNQNKNINENKKKDLHISSNKKEYFELEFKNQEKKQQSSQVNLEFDVQEQKKKDIEEDYIGSSNIKNKKGRKKKQYKSKKEAELDLFLKKYFLFQLRWDDPLNQRMTNNIKVYCLLLRLVNPKEIAISSIERGEMSLDVMVIQKDLALTELIKNGILIIEPVRLSIKWDEKLIMYQIMGISLVNKNKYQINGKRIKKKSVDKNDLEKSITQQYSNIFVNENKNYYDFLVPEHILSTRHRRELRILICFNSRNKNGVNGISLFGNENYIKNCKQFMNEDQYTHTNKLMKFKLFIWPNYRLEDLACMNRYWFNTNNGSRFTMSRIHMYPRFQKN
uniref:Protein TIC 214 n=1 Tax=Ottelia balansae TaxID=1046420 RepID=A0A8F5WGT8_9LILI|nr:hypothetical chloroplast RF19 [Ottelia balansae]QXP13182.1 hypothetical chloroplast RF19 [Ottelia balansae]QXP14030.1 hypothetical chloroplast RF19 [Ottelia balansae]